jgi:type III pantothenate kinase
MFVCNSQFTERELAAHGIAASKRMTIAHTPPARLAIAPLTESKDPRRVIYVGQIIPEKGIDLLLDAVGLLVGRGRDVRLDVVGPVDGWMPPEHQRHRDSLIARAGAPDLRGRVHFLGEREDVPQLMQAAAIHCCPSRKEQREAFGIVVIEAKLAGIPSVVMPSGALEELIAHGKDGWVCREETPGALAEGLEYFLDPDPLAHGMAAARRSASGFSHERFERAWGAVFLEAS